jgi:hypothetical protein
MMRFAVFSVIATVLILGLILLPGLLLLSDKWSVAEIEGADKEHNVKRQFVLSRFRWYMAIVPGLFILPLLFYIYCWFADKPREGLWHIVISMLGGVPTNGIPKEAAL